MNSETVDLQTSTLLTDTDMCVILLLTLAPGLFNSPDEMEMSGRVTLPVTVW